MKKSCGFRFQDHYVYRQIFPSGTYKIMVWTKDSLMDDEQPADVSFCGNSHQECMDQLKWWLVNE
jgi:hypothetical protein